MIEGGENSLRLSFAPVPAERTAEGVARIAARPRAACAPGRLTGAELRPQSLACRARHAPCVLALLGEATLVSRIANALLSGSVRRPATV